MILSIDTKLDAVNQVLSAIGESPVNSLENPTNVDVINALKELEKTSRNFQSRGWVFNTNSQYTLNPDVYTKKIAWNSSIIRLKSPSDGLVYTKRGTYLFNFTKQTDTFTAPVVLEVVLLVDFEDLPEQARNYITAKASLNFQVRFQGDELLIRGLEADLQEAWQEFQRYLLEIEPVNAFSNPDVGAVMGGRY